MKRNNYSIKTCLLFAEPLTKNESRTIKGGDFITDLLTNIFHRQPNVLNEQWNLFVANITDLASTTI